MENIAEFLKSRPPIQAGLLLSAVEAIGDRAAKLEGPAGAPIVIASYVGCALMMPYFVERHPLALVNGFWDAISNVFTFGIGFYYGERLSTTQVVGLGLISVGFVLAATGKQTL